MVYFFFPTQDATIYETDILMNTGIDEILELKKEFSTGSNDPDPYVSRILMKFDVDAIKQFILTNNVADPKFYLRLYTAEARSIPVAYTLYAYPVSQSWQMGIGRYSSLPQQTEGVSWKYRTGVSQDPWQTSQSIMNPGTTAAPNSEYGGGTWYTSYYATQSYDYEDTDVNMDVTTTVLAWISSSIVNDGFIVKRSTADERSNSQYEDLQFFSRETHTVYSPHLEIKWDDSQQVVSYNSHSFTTESLAYSSGSGSFPGYPVISWFTFNDSASFITSADTYTINTSSYTISQSYYQTGSIYTCSINSPLDLTLIGNLNGIFTASLIGYYSGSITGSYESASIVYTLSGSETGSLNGIFTGSYSGYYSGSISGSYSGSFTLSYISGSYVTSSMVTSSIYVPEVSGTYYDVTGSRIYYVSCSSAYIDPVDTEDMVIYFKNLKAEYKQTEKAKISVFGREKYPVKLYATQSQYLTVQYLPETTYYSVKDAHTEEDVISFDDTYTKVSCDINGNYFNLWMNGFSPERYYRILIKVENSGSVQIFDNKHIFKVVR